MPTFLDFIERANTGPILTEKDFNMKSLIPGVRDIVNEYEISLDKENPITSDDAMADRLYEASIELLVRTGIYCQDTNRVIQLDRKEILKSVRDFREGGASFGEGKDSRAFLSRKPEDHNLPWLHVGTGIVASAEKIAIAHPGGGIQRHPGGQLGKYSGI